MSNLIDRQAAIDALAKAMPTLTTPDGCGPFDREINIACEAFVDCMSIIAELQPAAQPEIIHCNACKHWKQTCGEMKGFGLGECDNFGIKLVTCDGFCYWAEREKDERY